MNNFISPTKFHLQHLWRIVIQLWRIFIKLFQLWRIFIKLFQLWRIVLSRVVIVVNRYITIMDRLMAKYYFC